MEGSVSMHCVVFREWANLMVNSIKIVLSFQDEMSRDIVLTSDFIRVRHIMLNVDLDRQKVISSGSVISVC
jgi:hypothetical protein